MLKSKCILINKTFHYSIKPQFRRLKKDKNQNSAIFFKNLFFRPFSEFPLKIHATKMKEKQF